jgi:hypothetical protein
VLRAPLVRVGVLRASLVGVLRASLVGVLLALLVTVGVLLARASLLVVRVGELRAGLQVR